MANDQPKGFSRREIEERLRSGAALRDFKRLVDAGCDADLLTYLLARLTADQRRHDTIEFQFGRSRRQVKRIAGEIDACATLIRALNVAPFAAYFRVHAPARLDLPALLEDYARAVRVVLAELGPRRRLHASIRLLDLIEYVKRVTGRLRDAEVASIVGAVRKTSYAAAAHKVWRLEQRGRFGALSEGLPPLPVRRSTRSSR